MLGLGPLDEIDRDFVDPPYRQIADRLRRQIEDGVYAPGRRLPSIDDLMQTYGVADRTARKALRLLVDEGVAEMSPGRGTFVRRRRGTPRAQDAD